MLAVGENEQNRIAFIRSAIDEHRQSVAYHTAVDAEEYYNGLNPTINRYEKIIYDMQGRSHTDMWTANHKLASRFFGLAVDQEVSYLLGNGVTFASINAWDMFDAVRRAVKLYRDKEQWNKLVHNAMMADNSWEKSTGEYIRMYESIW